MSIVRFVESFLAEYRRATGQQAQSAAGRPVVVAVSGGPDSVTLLHVLARRNVYPPDQIVVAHFDHQLRPGADGDAIFVAELAKEWGLTFRGGEADVSELAEREGLSLEAAAREARYGFLAAVALEVGALGVLTGHNQNDQAETVLMHLLRGSGLTGLRGMRPVAPLPGAPAVILLRPLLGVSRQAIEAYCQENQLAFVVDESNADTMLFRNRLRNELLPELIDYNPQIVAHLHNLASVIGAEDGLLHQLLVDAWPEVVTDARPDRISLDLAGWRALPLALRRRSLRHVVSTLRPDLTEIGFGATELARQVADKGQTGNQAILPGQLTLTVSYDRLIITAPGESDIAAEWPQLADERELGLAVPGRLELPGGWVITVERVEDIPFEVIAANPDPFRAYIRAEFGDGLRVRPRREGERFRPLGMDGKSTKVSNVMTNRKIPVEARPLWPIIAGPDHLLWLVGHSLDERARVRPDSGPALLLRVAQSRAVD